jgi:hypothetical protein
VLLAAALLAVTSCASGDDDNTNTAGLRLDGEFFYESTATVAPDRLGEALHDDVQLRDTRADVRAVLGVDEDDAVAVSAVPSDHARAGWFLFTADQDKAVDPWSDDELAEVVLPQD